MKLLGVIGLLLLGNLARRSVQRHLAKARLPRHPPRWIAALTTSRVAATPATTDPPAIDVIEHAGPIELRTLRRGLAAELGLGAAVLGLTSALVVSIPARQSYLRPFTKTVSASGLRASLLIDAPRVGDTVLHLSVRDSAGKSMPVNALSGSVALPTAGLGPLPLGVARGDAARATGSQDIRLSFPRKGIWLLQLTVQTSSAGTARFSVPVEVS